MQTNMRDASVTSERRKEQRKRPLGLVYVELSSANGGMLRDLSEQGFAMRAMMPLRAGDSTSFAFSLDPETRLEGQCKVLWVEEDGRLAGLGFTEIPKELVVTIREWLLENSFTARPASPASKTAQEPSTLQELREELRSITPNLHSSEDAGKSPTPTKEEFRPIPVQTRNDVPPPMKWGEPAQPTPVPAPESAPELAPLPGFETLEALPEMDSIPEPTRISRGFARTTISTAIRMMVVLAILACAVVFHRPLGNALIWLGQRIAGSDEPEISYAPKIKESSPQATSPPDAGNSSTTVADAPNSALTGTESEDKPTSSVPEKKSVEVPPVIQNTAPQEAKNQPAATPVDPVPLPATNRTTTFSSPASAASEQPGQQEYLQGEGILKDEATGQKLSEAVRLLWIAVKKGNSNAEVALAELYRTGHGVTKSCDQTSILLSAAKKKGNPEAQKRLDQFLKEGCE